MKKRLELDEKTKIKSYAHHAYLHSIANRAKIAEMNIDGIIRDKWEIIENDIESKIEVEKNIITLLEKENRTSTSLVLNRKSKIDDYVLLRLLDMNLINSLSNVKVSIEQENQKNHQRNTLFSFYCSR